MKTITYYRVFQHKLKFHRIFYHRIPLEKKIFIRIYSAICSFILFEKWKMLSGQIGNRIVFHAVIADPPCESYLSFTCCPIQITQKTCGINKLVAQIFYFYLFIFCYFLLIYGKITSLKKDLMIVYVDVNY